MATHLDANCTTVRCLCNKPSTPTHFGHYQNGKLYGSLAACCLVNFIESNPWSRTLTYAELAYYTNITCSNATIGRLLKKVGYRRCVAVSKPYLKEKHMRDRL
jgi:hypothetical protein